MLRPFFLIGSTVFWLAMTSQLIQKEFFQFTPISASYEVLPFHSYGIRDDYHAIYLGDQRVGFTYAALDPLDETDKKLNKKTPDSDDSFEIRHQNYMSFLLLGKENQILTRGKAKLNDKLQMNHFVIKITTKDYWNEIEGQVSQHQINLLIKGKDTETARKIVPIKGPVFYSESLDYLWTEENLKEGKQGTLPVWNPLLMEVEDIHFRVGEKTTLVSKDKDSVETYIVYLGKGEIEYRMWISQEGVVYQKESPTGLLIKREPGWVIFDSMRDKAKLPPDLPNLYSVPTNQIIEAPEKLKSLKIILKTLSEEKQMVISRQDFTTLAPSIIDPSNLTDELRFFLQDNEFVQTDDPEIRARSKEITQGETDVLKTALKIMDWTYHFVAPSPTVSVPSAKQVLTTQKGDCNEYTILFTALARSAGIPTRMVSGLVYRSGRFFYHAWAEVYAGQTWVALDPTFNQAPVDATHIPISKGSLKDQMHLLNQIGKNQVILIEQTY